MANQETIRTPRFRAAWVYAFSPKVDKKTAKEKYGLGMLFDSDADLSQMRELAEKTLKSRFGESAKLGVGYKNPFAEGDTKEQEYCHGKTVVNANTQFEPIVVDRNRRKISDEKDFYGGCYALATVHCYAYEVEGNKGVSFGLDSLQFHSHGDPISSGPTIEESYDDLDEVEGTASGAVDGDMA